MPLETPYVPISCAFYDLLEAIAISRRVVAICFCNDDGKQVIKRARIVDFVVRSGVEFVELEGGKRIRLDRLLSVDDERLTDY